MLEINWALIRLSDVISPSLIRRVEQRQMIHCDGALMMGFAKLSLIVYVALVVVAAAVAVDQLTGDVGQLVVQLNSITYLKWHDLLRLTLVGWVRIPAL